MTDFHASPGGRAILGAIVQLLARSPFSSPSKWAAAVVVLRREEKRVTSRADFASWLDANALPDLARECRNRKAAPGSVLVYFDAEGFDVGFQVARIAA